MSLALLISTINFAAVKHQNQRRKDPQQTPYINHPIGVADILANEAGVTDDLIVLQAAILHDTVEDTETTFEEIEGLFGKEVAQVVREVTDDMNLPKMKRKNLQVENAPHKSDRAKLVKLADKIYNLRDLNLSTPKGWTAQRVEEYFEWAEKVTNGCKGVNDKLDQILVDLYAARKQ